MKSFVIFGIILVWSQASQVQANDDHIATQLDLNLRYQLQRVYAGASRIEWRGPIQWVRGGVPEKVESLQILSDDSKGNLQFSVWDGRQVSEGRIGFSAWAPAYVAVKRIRPGELLQSTAFQKQEVDISSGMAREYRGLIFPSTQEIQGFESIQTVLEGQFLTLSAVQKTPDIRRGDSVRIHLKSGELTLSVLGIAEEPGYVAKRIKVLTGKSKREFTGLLSSGGIVEVNL